MMKDNLDYIWKGLVTVLLMISAWGAMRVVADVDVVRDKIENVQLEMERVKKDIEYLKKQP